MKLRWPWLWFKHEGADIGNGHAATTAKREAEQRLRAQVRRWPEVHDALAEAAEQATRRRYQ